MYCKKVKKYRYKYSSHFTLKSDFCRVIKEMYEKCRFELKLFVSKIPPSLQGDYNTTNFMESIENEEGFGAKQVTV